MGLLLNVCAEITKRRIQLPRARSLVLDARFQLPGVGNIAAVKRHPEQRRLRPLVLAPQINCAPARFGRDDRRLAGAPQIVIAAALPVQTRKVRRRIKLFRSSRMPFS